jgi:hypothetical protein
MYRRAEAWASATTRSSSGAAEQLGHRFLVRDRTRPTSGNPLAMGLEHGIGFRSF